MPPQPSRVPPPKGKNFGPNPCSAKKLPSSSSKNGFPINPTSKGKYVLIDFWATWCPPCRKAIPELNGYHKKFKDKLVVIGISDETEEKVRALKTPTIEYFSAIDTKAVMKKQVQVTGIPHVLLLDPDWVVRWEGFPLLKDYELTEEVIAGILKGASDGGCTLASHRFRAAGSPVIITKLLFRPLVQ